LQERIQGNRRHRERLYWITDKKEKERKRLKKRLLPDSIISDDFVFRERGYEGKS
jgi:hypothetical protein